MFADVLAFIYFFYWVCSYLDAVVRKVSQEDFKKTLLTLFKKGFIFLGLKSRYLSMNNSISIEAFKILLSDKKEV